MKRITLFLTLGVCAVSPRALAQPRAAKPASLAKVAPPELTKKEQQAYAKIVALADADGNSHVSGAELEALVSREVRKQAGFRFQRLDRNHDGRVVAAEVPSMLKARFQRFDQNADGSFTLTELTRVVEAQALERCRAAFIRLDHDGDGTLSFADADAAQPARLSEG
jgi:Ca2+-binding EF-hand superfamily protein